MKKLRSLPFPFWLFLIGFPLVCFLSTTVGAMDTPDSYLYYILAGYIRFGHIGWVAPFNWDKPQTLFGPIYGLFGSYVSDPTFSQLIFLLVGGLLVYYILKKLLATRWAFVGAIIFIILPFNIIYATMIMSETLTGFLLILYIAVLYMVIKRPSWWANAPILVLLSSVLTLTRYAYGLLFILSIILCFVYVPKKWFEYLFIAAGVGLLVWWLVFNHRTNNVWSLSVVEGRHLYNSVVYDGHILPPDTLPIVQTFHKYFPSEDAFFEPWWVNQNYFAVDKRLPEWKIDEWYGELALTAIRYHPLAYLWHVVGNVFILPTRVPYYKTDTVASFAACNRNACHVTWNPIICQPRVYLCPAQAGWATYIYVSTWVQPFTGWLCAFLAWAGAIFALLRGTKYLKILAVIFIAMYVSQAALEIKEGRFLIPLYPLYAIFIPLCLSKVYAAVTSFNSDK